MLWITAIHEGFSLLGSFSLFLRTFGVCVYGLVQAIALFLFSFFFSSWDECKLRHLKRGWDLMYQIIIDFKDPKA